MLGNTEEVVKKKDNPGKLPTPGTQEEEKKTHTFVLDNNLRMQTQ